MDYTDSISLANLANGERVALGCIEIVEIPHFTVIDESATNADATIERCSRECANCLAEVYQVYKTALVSGGYCNDMAIELLWTSKAVDNQAYKASVHLHLVVRSISRDSELAIRTVNVVMASLQSTLSSQRYGIQARSYEELNANVIAMIDDSSIRAIVKEEALRELNNAIVPYCYSYGRVMPSRDDLNRVISALAGHPGCAFSIQLIPTSFTKEEMTEIDSLSHSLRILSNGLHDMGVGNVSFALAQAPAELYDFYSQRKSAPLFMFCMVAYGTAESAAEVVGRVTGRLSAGDEATANWATVDLSRQEVDKNNNFYPLPWAINELLRNKGRNPQAWATGKTNPALYRVSSIISLEEAAELMRLPIGSDRVSAGLRIGESSKRAKTYADNVINSGDIVVGKLRSSDGDDTIGFSLKDLAKHMLVVGTPGSGKTTFSVSLLDRLWKDHGIPFLVIEPAKNEYRALIQSIPDLQVFTPGKSFISPFVFNPFLPPDGVRLETYKSTLKTAFAAGVSMTTPLDKIFEETINNCYSDFRWLDTYTVADKGQVFNISDFVKCFQQTFESIGYTGDAGNIGRAGMVRLNSLVNLFDNYYSIPIEDLLSKPTVIELAAIENSDQKALIIALLLLSILAYVNANYIGEGGLKNVILLEEAHVLLDADSNAGQGDANPSQIAQGLVKRMLAELRSYGVSLVIADQSPRKVTTDVVALTDMKVAFRLVESSDKQILGDSINMTEAQLQRLGKLKPGEAFLFYGKLEEPEEVITPDYRLENNISITLTDNGIRDLSTYWDGKEDKLRPYPECKLCRFCQHSCDYNRRVLARDIARRLFVKSFKPQDKTYEPLKELLSHISRSIKAELNDEPFTPELLLCVKVHLWRRIRYGTKIPITQTQIENSLRK